ncbi:MAG: hypothetical protein ACOC7U_01060, partial [Spirochaetota bacterium]
GGGGIDFAVSLPGTNTIQLAYRKIPSLVVAALNKPEVIPVEGPAGVLKWVPVLGKWVLKKAASSYIKSFRFAALPNIYLNREAFPELFGVIKTSDITQRLYSIFTRGDDLSIRSKLECFSYDHSPAELMVREIWEDNHC